MSMLNADTKFMPVGDLDFGVPGASVAANNNHNSTFFNDEDDDASITTTQINALAERNKERVARLQKWKDETAANHNDPRISQNNAIEDPDEVLAAFKERIEKEEKSHNNKNAESSVNFDNPVRSESPHEAEHQTRRPSARSRQQSRGRSRSRSRQSQRKADEV